MYTVDNIIIATGDIIRRFTQSPINNTFRNTSRSGLYIPWDYYL